MSPTAAGVGIVAAVMGAKVLGPLGGVLVAVVSGGIAWLATGLRESRDE